MEFSCFDKCLHWLLTPLSCRRKLCCPCHPAGTAESPGRDTCSLPRRSRGRPSKPSYESPALLLCSSDHRATASLRSLPLDNGQFLCGSIDVVRMREVGSEKNLPEVFVKVGELTKIVLGGAERKRWAHKRGVHRAAFEGGVALRRSADDRL